jgi:hypothetical protein
MATLNSQCPGQSPISLQASNGRPGSKGLAGTPACQVQEEGGHQLEKLEFALAVAITRGDQQRSDQLRAQIAELGGNREEPGT